MNVIHDHHIHFEIRVLSNLKGLVQPCLVQSLPHTDHCILLQTNHNISFQQGHLVVDCSHSIILLQQITVGVSTQRASYAEHLCFLWYTPEQIVEQWIASDLWMWHHCNDTVFDSSCTPSLLWLGYWYQVLVSLRRLSVWFERLETTIWLW